ncbi:MAG: GNAT family N-acetyltransferase [Thermoleophilaceae bacterium]
MQQNRAAGAARMRCSRRVGAHAASLASVPTRRPRPVMIVYAWRGEFTNAEINALHAEAFQTGVFDDWDWAAQLRRHSLGWVTARDGTLLVGFVNLITDGEVHAWIQDTMVAADHRHRGVGTALVMHATDAARNANCQFLHVDFDDHLRGFYFGACGFSPTNAGLIEL